MVRRLLLVLGGACAARDDQPPVKPRPTAPIVARANDPIDAGTVVADANAPDASTRASRVELTFMGDIMFGGYFDDHGYTPILSEEHDPLVEVESLIDSDFALANLETTIAPKIDLKETGHKRFVTLPSRVAPLARHKVDGVSLANNHLYDNGSRGLVETPELAKQAGLRVFGASGAGVRVETLELSGWRVGIVAVTTRLNARPKKADPAPPAFDEDKARAALVPIVTAARAEHDLVIVVIHWGTEYVDAPSRWQVDTAHALVDAGADAIVGHHVHVLQGIERYKGAVIAYSLGNFLFQNGKEIIRQAGVLRLGFAMRDRACLELAAFHPTVQLRSPEYHPVPATGNELAIAEQRLASLSKAKPLATTWKLDGPRLVTKPACD